MNTKPNWRDFGGPTEKNPTRYLARNRVYWNTDSLKSLLEAPDEDVDVWKASVKLELNERDKASVNNVWNGRDRFPVVLARPLARNARNKDFFGEGLLLWLHIEGVDGGLAGDKEVLEQQQQDILGELPFAPDAVNGILKACRIAKAYSVPPVLLRRKAGPCFADIGERITGGSASLAVAAWLTWHKRHLWPSKPLVITGELTKDGKVKSVEMLKEKLAAAKDRGVDFLVTPGEPGAKDAEGLIKVPGEGKKFEEWLEACEQRLQEHDIYLRQLWAHWPDLAGLEVKREGFIGRQWLREEIGAWSMNHPDQRGLLLLGKPGSGKSAFVADLVQREDWQPRVLACHICRDDMPSTGKPELLVEKLVEMLSDFLPDFRRQRELNHRGLASSNPIELLQQEVLTPLKEIRADTTCYLVVDGLDESLNSDGQEHSVVGLLAHVADQLPPWLRLVVTSQPAPNIVRKLSSSRWRQLELATAENERHNRKDLTEYLNSRIKEPLLSENIGKQLGNSLPKRDLFLNSLLDKTEGNFLFLKAVLDGLKDGVFELDKIPGSLAGVYQRYFDRFYKKDKQSYYDATKGTGPLLSLIVAGREPLAAAELGEMLECSAVQVKKELDPLGAYVNRVGDRYQIYHKSFSEWLEGKAASPHDVHDFLLDLEKSRELLTDWCFKQFNYKEAKMSDYARRHLIAHLVELKRWEEVRMVLTSFEFLHDRVEQGKTAELISDCELAASVVGSPVQGFAKLLGGAMRLSEGALRADPSHLPSQLVGRLLDSSDPDIQLLLTDVILRARKPWLRPRTRSLTAPGGPLVRTLNSPEMVACVTVTPDGRYILSSGEDKTLKVWDLTTGDMMKTLESHTDNVWSMAVTPDGRHIISGAFDKTLKVWDLETGALLRTLKGHTDRVYAVSVMPDSRRAVSGSKDKTLKVWDLETGALLRTLEGHTDCVYAVSVTPGGHYVVSGAGDKTLKVWDLETGDLLRTLEGHKKAVASVAVTPDGHRAVSASADKTLKVWDLTTGDMMKTLEGHTDEIYSVSVTPDGRRAVSGAQDATLKVWDLETGALLRTLVGHTNTVRSVLLTFDGRRVVSGSEDNTLKVWDLEIGALPRTSEGHTKKVWSVAVTPDGRRAVSGSQDWTLKVWDLVTGALLRTLEGHSDEVGPVSLTPDGRRAVSVSLDKTLKVWDLETGTLLRTLEGHTDCVYAVSLTPDGRRAVSASEDNTLKVWDLQTGDLLRTLEGHKKAVASVAVTPDGHRAISASEDNTLKVWDLETGALLRTLEGHSGSVYAVSVTPDGRRVISGSKDKTLKVWDLETGALLRTLNGHTAAVRVVAVTPDGRRVVSRSDDKTLKVWDLEIGTLLHTIGGQADNVWSQAFTPDGRVAVSGSRLRMIRVWDLETGKTICSYEAYSSVSALVCSPDGQSICAGDNMGHIHFLHLESGD